LRITTDRLSNAAGVIRDAVVVSTWNCGVVPIDSALPRNRLEPARSPLSTTMSETGALGVSTKLNRLSAGSGSVPARTVPRTFAPVSVNCVKATEPDACAATLACSVWISWPSMVSVTGTFFSASSPLLLRPAVTVMRSCPENDARAKLTDGTARLAVFGDATETVLSVISSPKRTSSDPLQPLRWKSLISTVSRRLIGDRVRMLSASFSAGP